MTRDPLLPVHKADGVWTTEGAGSAAVPTVDAPPSTGARNFPCDPYPPSAPRSIFAAVALDGSGVWAIGDTEADARADAIDRRGYLRDCARSVDCDFPDASTDAAWLDTLALITLSGTTESLRALIKSMETGDPVAPWCPRDLWDSGEVTP